MYKLQQFNLNYNVNIHKRDYKKKLKCNNNQDNLPKTKLETTLNSKIIFI